MKKSSDRGETFIMRKRPNTQLSGETAQIRRGSSACGPWKDLDHQHRNRERKQRGGQADGEAVLCVCSTCDYTFIRAIIFFCVCVLHPRCSPACVVVAAPRMALH